MHREDMYSWIILAELAGIYIKWENYRLLNKKAPEVARLLLKLIGCKTLVIAAAKDPIHRLQFPSLRYSSSTQNILKKTFPKGRYS
ncbi:hypothetical protein CE91St62_00320 [Lachnospiraceae bacterium]|uniref:hypothetical protein n=1 Tax=Extibacter sp. GGCC_0201 TaxID=2731209 RepID=UPI001AA1332E|nr:hypothetical protein [Extibacter sp. GGCC_0201]MDV9527837.1 hypothetical protein [Clostridioides difficile]BDF31957.1 hypothetical protein CE91St61_00320 [Lachnospiraceae bacterium]BDF35971.1 hypothetical protein CE91St62_00320 [Lachnospiraceae bacterium]